MSTPVSKQSPLENLADRAAAFKMKGVTVDGNDIIAVAEAVLEGMKKAANNEPNVVEIKVTRWEGHYVGDKDEIYRDVNFRKNLADIDPVLKLKKKLESMGYMDDALADKIRAEVTAEIEEAFDYGIAQPIPTREQVLDANRMYANPKGVM
jgi:pyruvate dehydrogenase E1 component alpha subunit